MTPIPTPAELQRDLHAWLVEHDSEFTTAKTDCASMDFDTAAGDEIALQQALWNEGFMRWGWEESVGGLGGSAILRAAAYEQICLDGYRIPKTMSTIETLGPVMIKLAPDVASRFLENCIAGREAWCQGFSEPEAGSDLASLRCKATPDGDGWRVSGQKLWSSVGTISSRIAMLVRTGEPGHKGISMFLMDLDSPGCEPRPTRASSGRNEFIETFFDDVYVSNDRLVGGLNRGWYVAMDLLQWERGMYAWQRQAALHVLLATSAAHVPKNDTATRELIEETWTMLTALRAKSASTVKRLAVGESPGPEVSVDKILLALCEQAVHDIEVAIDPVGFVLNDGSQDEVLRGDWYYSRMAPIYGGAIDVQRGIVAERVLGLPRSAR